MRLIDADRLLQHTKFYNLKNGNRAIDEVDILHAQTVNAIPIDKVKQAREEIANSMPSYTSREQLEGGDPIFHAVCECVADDLAILDKLIAESED